MKYNTFKKICKLLKSFKLKDYKEVGNRKNMVLTSKDGDSGISLLLHIYYFSSMNVTSHKWKNIISDFDMVF